jgi:hypothetical protein
MLIANLRLLMLAVLAAIKWPSTPDRDKIVDALAWAVANDPKAPAFESREFDSVILVLTAVRESGMRARAVGDGGKSLCFMQLQLAPESVLSDAYECAMRGLAAIHRSVEACPESPLAPYMGGCRRVPLMAARRLAEARKIFTEIDSL